MSSLIRTALMLGLFPAALMGQVTQEDALVELINTLEVAHASADAAADRADSLQRAEAHLRRDFPIDTVRVGPFFVVAPQGQLGKAERYFRTAWASYADAMGTEPTPLNNHHFTFQADGGRRDLGVEGATAVSTRFARGRGAIMEHRIAQHIGHVLSADVPGDLWEWMGGPFYLGTRPERELERAFRALATTPSSATHECYEGAANRCWDALGLENRDTWWTSWYDADHRTLLVSRIGADRDIRDVLSARCVESGDDTECRATLSAMDAHGWIPLSTGVRMTLVRHALTLGGSGSFQRLMAPAEGSLPNRLARVAGTDAEQLITSWRASVMTHRPDTRARAMGGGLTSLLWMAVLAALSMRSTKWRLN